MTSMSVFYAVVALSIALGLLVWGRRIVNWLGAILVRDFREAEGLDISEGVSAHLPRETLDAQSPVQTNQLPSDESQPGERIA
ncbi:hypothetical protein MRS76_21010 [Rhizobiaceae bacterium n13]|uniref:Uncharacterized protein n=1 Tax=Ferirhizobium litorale TaxID=2927786 RepID=A0AAE3QK41_9HYPH|nr:hypothetical protein [Fererhizobium litorale]MDI7864422.1 hypothetical protein [Fererhizobium litorale]MDI7924664.1 hypothetical protein [Fererhizobium litorale]